MARDEPLLAWQWRHYGDHHQNRGNLIIHLVTWPLFVAGLAALISGAIAGRWWMLGAGPAAMVLAIALQGRGHRREVNPPLPFDGPLDVVARIFVEQLITFPRYLLTGALGRAWRDTTIV